MNKDKTAEAILRKHLIPDCYNSDFEASENLVHVWDEILAAMEEYSSCKSPRWKNELIDWLLIKKIGLSAAGQELNCNVDSAVQGYDLIIKHIRGLDESTTEEQKDEVNELEALQDRFLKYQKESKRKIAEEAWSRCESITMNCIGGRDITFDTKKYKADKETYLNTLK
jgi:hypothetical protein